MYIGDRNVNTKTEFIFGGYDTRFMTENFTYHTLA